jgi:hypothetical protein
MCTVEAGFALSPAGTSLPLVAAAPAWPEALFPPVRGASSHG